MLDKINRLLKENDFENVFRKGKPFYGQGIGVKSVKNNLNYNRFGISISSNFSKKATVRNKLKRRVREAIRSALNKLKPGHDVLIIISSPEISGKKYAEIKRLILAVFEKLRLS